MTLTLHHADELEPLLDQLAHILSAPLADPFTADVVVVPTAGVRDTVTAHLGRRLGVGDRGHDGVTANVDLLYVGGFVNRVLGLRPHDDDLDPDPWHISRLTWTVLDVLADVAADERFELPVAEVSWSFARRVADLFDRYATQRPQLIEAWSRGLAVDAAYGLDELTSPLGADHRWQFDVWREVRHRIGSPSLPERLPELLEMLRTGAFEPDVPARVAVIGFVSVAPAQWQLLHALSQVRDVHVLMRTPSRQAWNDSHLDLAGQLVSVRSVAGDTLDVTAGRQHPLLVSWGRRALEGRAFIGGTPDVRTIDANRPLAEPTTLLHTVQSDIRLDRTPVAWPGWRDRDRSLQVHACHGPTRQLEVLRDALGHVFVDHPDLEPNDVVVVCPQLDRFAPLVEAVFARGDMPIPVRVGDRSLSVDDPVASTLAALLDLAVGRVSMSEVMALLQRPAVRRRFAWSPSDVETITEWALDVGARWGLSPEHRESVASGRDDEVGTWSLVVRRLLAGLAQSAAEPRLALGGIPPFDGIAPESGRLAGSLAEFFARLLHLHDAVHGARPIADWVALLHATVDEFCGPDPDDPWSLPAVHTTLEALVEAASTVDHHGATVPCGRALSLQEIRQVLDDALESRAGRLDLRTGSVTVTSMLPMHGVPARVVCLLGLDDASLAGGSFDGDDILGLSPCVGERNPRHDSRQMLLDIVLAAQDALVITCNGADLSTNAPVPFTVALSELLDVAAATIGVETSQPLPIVARHPRHGFAERALSERPEPPLLAVLDRPFTFDTAMLRAAEGHRRLGDATPTHPALRWHLTEHRESSIDVATLVTALTAPAAIFLRDRLGVGLVRGSGAIDDDHGLTVDRLTESTLGRDLLARAAVAVTGGATGSDDPDDPAVWDDLRQRWSEVARFDADVPLGTIGKREIDHIESRVQIIRSAARAAGVPLRGHDRVDIGSVVLEVELDGGDVTTVTVSGVVGGVHHIVADPAADGGPDAGVDGGSVIVDVDVAPMKPTRRLAAAVRLALATLADPSRPWSAVVVGFNSGAGASVTRLTLRGDVETSARDVVARAVQMLWWSSSDAVPFFGHEPSKVTIANLDAAIAYKEASVLWSGWDGRSLLDQRVLDHDPSWLRRGDKRAVATAAWVWEAVTDAVEETDPTKKPKKSAPAARRVASKKPTATSTEGAV